MKSRVSVLSESNCISLNQIIIWIQARLKEEGCLYQADIVDYLIKNEQKKFLKINSEGDHILTLNIHSALEKNFHQNIVWVASGRYWRYRVLEDEEGYHAAG